MKCLARLCLVWVALLAASVSARAQGSMFYFTSSAQSIIGQGETFTASSTNGFTITAQRNNNNGVSLIIISDSRYWFLDFAAPGDALLAPGTYNNATLYPYQSGSPGMLFSGEGRSVASLTGYFNVLAIDYGPGNTINRFDADFLQNDEGIAAQSNMGSIRFDAVSPVPEPSTLPLVAAGILALFAMNWRRRSRR